MADTPVHLPNQSFQWNCRNWQWHEWREFLSRVGDQAEVKFRLGLREELPGGEPQWERNNRIECATFEQFLSWSGCVNENIPSRLSCYDRDKYWAYHAYVYMHDWKDSNTQLFDKLGIDWSELGLPCQDSAQSVFWLGSCGAHTLCHYDTYGCNLVVQLRGRKRWTLYPPSDTRFLYPTRVPYEESSVFSSVNMRAPDLNKFPQVVNARAHVVELSAGDVLFVPRHWWHLVETLETSLSINTWIPQMEDHLERLKEMLVVSLLTALPVDQQQLSNSADMSPWKWRECISCLNKIMSTIPLVEKISQNSSTVPPPPDHHNPPPDHHNPPPDHHNPPPDHHNPPPDHHNPPPDHHNPPPDHHKSSQFTVPSSASELTSLREFLQAGVDVAGTSSLSAGPAVSAGNVYSGTFSFSSGCTSSGVCSRSLENSTDAPQHELKGNCVSDTELSEQSILLGLFDAITQPDVIDLIADNFLKSRHIRSHEK